MSFVLTAHFTSGVYEMQLPSVNNRSVQLEIPREVSGLASEIALSLDVFNEVWSLVPNEVVSFPASVTLTDGLRVDARLSNGSEVVILVETLALGLSRFTKYYVNNAPITVGRGNNNTISYANQLVGSNHTRIELSGNGGATLIDESRNGVFVNGKRVNKQQSL
ncbi:MAG: FHA domain-containing protein, partial [Oscillospiraceae bacterium]|nr:FHA domain-containing protein [Oscillospiraceae bacterium]